MMRVAFGARSFRDENTMSIVDVLATANDDSERPPQRIGPYSIYGEIGAGGMASVYLGKLESAAGFSRVVAIKRMHAELARSPEFVEMFLQEARLVGRIQHPNVVAALDCVATDKSAMLIMEYVHGVSLSQITRKPLSIPLPAASAIVLGAALGLHAAHEAVDLTGKSLGIVHRDVSPQNILIGVDGLARVLDFGVAKAAEKSGHTRAGEIKGKLSYMAPEQLLGEDVGREADIYSLGVILWELVTGRRLFRSEGTGHIMTRIAQSQIDSPRSVNPNVSPEISAVVMKAVAGAPQARYRTALEFAAAIERTIPVMAQRTLGAWIAEVAKDELARRALVLSRVEQAPSNEQEAPAPDRPTLPRLVPAGGRARGAVDTGKRGGTVVSLVALVKRPSTSRAYIGAAAAFAVVLVTLVVALWPRHATVLADESSAVGSASAVRSVSARAPVSVETTVATQPPTATAAAVEGSPQPSSGVAAPRGGGAGPSTDLTALPVAASREAPRPAAPRARPSKPKAGAPGQADPDLGVIGGRE
jgi:serine/threonine-protein kinase